MPGHWSGDEHRSGREPPHCTPRAIERCYLQFMLSYFHPPISKTLKYLGLEPDCLYPLAAASTAGTRSKRLSGGELNPGHSRCCMTGEYTNHYTTKDA